MKRRTRDVAIFSLSALDVLAMSTGVFVLLMVMMLPYYKKTQQAQASLQGLAVASERAEADAASLAEAAARETSAAEATAAEAARIASAAAALEARIAAAQARAARAVVSPAPRPVEPTPPSAPPPTGTPTLAEMDLVFVVDTTASMTPVIRDLAVSMRGITRVLQRLVPSLRVGIVGYSDRDTGRDPLTILPLTATDRFLPRIVAFLERLQASPVGSQTVEEDMYMGLQAATSLPLRPSARQAFIVVADAPAHPWEQAATLQLVRSFVGRNPGRSVSALFVTTPGSLARGQIDRVFLQDVARAGGGTFTDHAGSMIESVLLSVLVE